MMRYLQLFIIMLFSVLSCPSFATIYRWVDTNNVVHFSEEPHPNATIEKPNSVQTFQPVETTPKSNPKSSLPVVTIEPLPSQQTNYTSFGFLTPQPESTLHTNEGMIKATLQISPALAKGDRIEFYLDGKLVTIKDPNPSPNINPASEQFDVLYTNVFRGEHTISAELIDQNDTTVKQTSVKFYIFHASKLSQMHQQTEDTVL